jgi:cyclic beta-1,2-glucan synthetase
MYQLILEGLLGIIREGDFLRLEPKLHPDWPSCSVQYRFKSATYRINIQRKKNDATARKVFLDGAELSSNILNLMDDDKEHIVNVEVNVEVNAKVNRMT